MSLLRKYTSLLRGLFLAAALSACNKDSTLSNAPCMPTYEAEQDCDGVDNNCSGEIDEGCDDDGDEYCDALMRLGYISPDEENPYYLEPDFPCKKTFELNPLEAWLFMDCDDLNSLAHPLNTELCNGFDDNCDLYTDNVFPEQGIGCYLHLATGDIIDVSTLDTTSATSLEGLCGPSTIACELGRLSCTGLGQPEERCDGVDNNCNKLIDELIGGVACYGGWGEVDGYMQYIDGLEPGSVWNGTLNVGECEDGQFTCTQSCEMLPEYILSCQPYTMGGDQLCEGAKTPLPEICNGKNEDCDPDGIDEDYDTDNDTYSTCGTYARQIERMTPQTELEDCDDEDASVNPGMLETICNGKDDDCDPATIDATDNDQDAYPIDCAPAIPADCDDNPDDDPEFCAYVGVEDCTDSRFSACAPCIHPGAPEVCGDCRDNNCRDGIDESAVPGIPYDIFLFVDISGSMSDVADNINTAIRTLLIDECTPEENYRITTILVGRSSDDEPYLAGIQETIGELRANYEARLPGGGIGGSGNENMLDALLYLYCWHPAEDFLMVSDAGEVSYLSEYEQLCLPLENEFLTIYDDLGRSSLANPHEYFKAGNAFSDIRREGLAGKIISLTDEDAQTKYASVNQSYIGRMGRFLGYDIILFTSSIFYNTVTIDGARGGMNQGFAYLAGEQFDGVMNCIPDSNLPKNGCNGKWIDIRSPSISIPPRLPCQEALTNISDWLTAEFTEPVCPPPTSCPEEGSED